MTTMTQNPNRVSEAQGNLIDQFRNHVNIDAFVKAFAQQSQDLETAAFEVLEDTLLTTSVGTQLDNIGSVVGVERGGKNDADYRIRILAQILLNKSSGTIPEMLVLATLLGATSVELIEVFPAKIEIEVCDTLPNGDEIGAVLVLAKAAGVGFKFQWFDSAIPFTFDTAGQGFDQGELAEMIGA
jgi:hypothetical protein